MEMIVRGNDAKLLSLIVFKTEFRNTGFHFQGFPIDRLLRAIILRIILQNVMEIAIV